VKIALYDINGGTIQLAHYDSNPELVLGCAAP